MAGAPVAFPVADAFVPQVTTTGATPAEAGAGAVHVISVEDTTMTPEHAAPPTVAEQPAAKFAPKM